VERWRTRALLGGLVLIAAGGVVAVVLAQTNDSSQASKTGGPQLSASAQNPFTVDGTKFRKGERVHVVAKGSGAAAAATTRANARTLLRRAQGRQGM
jgi:hypothetical protein